MFLHLLPALTTDHSVISFMGLVIRMFSLSEVLRRIQPSAFIPAQYLVGPSFACRTTLIQGVTNGTNLHRTCGAGEHLARRRSVGDDGGGSCVARRGAVKGQGGARGGELPRWRHRNCWGTSLTAWFKV